jgi:hypothetical protein
VKANGPADGDTRLPDAAPMLRLPDNPVGLPSGVVTSLTFIRPALRRAIRLGFVSVL